jgi:Hemerythrin HHE cation binding domain
MPALAQYLLDDHARLEDLLLRSVAVPGEVEPALYEEFRAGLLRHIGIEEKLLLPAVRRARGGTPLALARRLHVEHGAIAGLLVPTPTPALVAELRGLLARHNALEEGAGGLYDDCERALGAEAGALLERIRAAPAVPTARHFDGPGTWRTAAEAIAAMEAAEERRHPPHERIP